MKTDKNCAMCNKDACFQIFKTLRKIASNFSWLQKKGQKRDKYFVM